MSGEWETLSALVRRCRSYRRFDEGVAVERGVLEELVGLARLGASAGNLQPLRFYLSSDPETNAAIFSTLRWAAYLKDWPGPAEGERPAAYIVVLRDRGIKSPFVGVDAGIASQNILLGAVARGLGGCIVASVDREELGRRLGLPAELEILHVIALGRPAEEVVVEEMGPDGDVRYWRDTDGVHHVPKRPLAELIVNPRPRAGGGSGREP